MSQIHIRFLFTEERKHTLADGLVAAGLGDYSVLEAARGDVIVPLLSVEGLGPAQIQRMNKETDKRVRGEKRREKSNL